MPIRVPLPVRARCAFFWFAAPANLTPPNFLRAESGENCAQARQSARAYPRDLILHLAPQSCSSKTVKTGDRPDFTPNRAIDEAIGELPDVYQHFNVAFAKVPDRAAILLGGAYGVHNSGRDMVLRKSPIEFGRMVDTAGVNNRLAVPSRAAPVEQMLDDLLISSFGYSRVRRGSGGRSL
jgi:hypothetical protein